MFLGGRGQKSSLAERLSDRRTPPRVNFGVLVKELDKARDKDKDISIRGASARGNLIEVKGLVAGTTADDVEVGSFNSSFIHTNCIDQRRWRRRFSSVVDPS